MPFMDGLELSRLVKHELPETKIIFLSGYDEFQYAKEAIDIGITDYLVKPVTGAQLIGTLKKIGQKIEEERGKQKQQAPEEARSAGRQRLFRHMVSGKHTYASVFQEAKELGLELIAEQYNIMLLQLFSEEKEDVLPEKIKAFEQELEKYMEQSGNLIVAKQSRAEYDFVLKGTGQQSLAETTEQVKSLLAEYFRRETAVEYVAALGTPVERFSELQQCYRQTNLCFSRRYSVERNQILEEETPGETAAEVLEDVKLGELNISSLSQRHEQWWSKHYLSHSVEAWQGLTFELLCLFHISQIRKALNIGGVASEAYIWFDKADKTKNQRGAQIDLIIERADRVINLCEMKFSQAQYKISADYEIKLRNRMELFRDRTHCTKSLVNTFVTTFGVANGIHSSIVNSEVTLDNLFQE